MLAGDKNQGDMVFTQVRRGSDGEEHGYLSIHYSSGPYVVERLVIWASGRHKKVIPGLCIPHHSFLEKACGWKLPR